MEQVVSKLSPTLQSLVVSDRVVEARKSADEWKDICKLMAANPEVINERLSLNESTGPRVFRRMNADLSDPTVVSWQQFLQLPLSQPIWNIMISFEINQNDPIWDRWWKKIKNDQKDPYVKLCKYIQALRQSQNP